MSVSRIFSLAAAVVLGGTAWAHTVWIEPLEERLVIRFAEPGNDFEKSPGYLDSLSEPLSFKAMPGTNAPVQVGILKNGDHFLLGGVVPTNAVCTESIFTVRGGRKPYFYARWQPAGVTGGRPLLTLDLVPTRAGEVRAWFRGKPLGGAKVFLRTPDGKERELVTDAEGFVRFDAAQRGQYLLTLPHHREELEGFHLGRAYKQASHNGALTWRQP